MNNTFEVGYWGKSNDIAKIQKSLAYIEAGLKHFNGKTKNELYFKDEYSGKLADIVCENPSLDGSTSRYIYNTLCDGVNSDLNSKVKGCISSLAANSVTPQDIKDKILRDHQIAQSLLKVFIKTIKGDILNLGAEWDAVGLMNI